MASSSSLGVGVDVGLCGGRRGVVLVVQDVEEVRWEVVVKLGISRPRPLHCWVVYRDHGRTLALDFLLLLGPWVFSERWDVEGRGYDVPSFLAR